MQALLFLSAILTVSCAKETFPSHYDNFDVEAMFKNRPYFLELLNCFLDKGPCDEMGTFGKGIMTEAIHGACEKCGPTMKHQFKRFMGSTSEVFPNKMEEFLNKYDPERKYIPKFLTALSNS